MRFRDRASMLLRKSETTNMVFFSLCTAFQPSTRHVNMSTHKKRAKRNEAKDIWERVAVKWKNQDQVERVLKKYNT